MCPIQFPYPEKDWAVGKMRKRSDYPDLTQNGNGEDEQAEQPDQWSALQQQAKDVGGRLMIGVSERKAFDATNMPIDEAIRKVGADPDCKEATNNPLAYLWCVLKDIGATVFMHRGERTEMLNRARTMTAR